MFDSIPECLPVMTLPNTVLFPNTVMPLHIFEPRYRHMLDDVLGTNRMFAVAHLAPGPTAGLATQEPPFPIATAGVIRACQKNTNGTSDLLLEGVARVRIRAVVQEEPYRVIEVEPIPDETLATPEQLTRLAKRLINALALHEKLGQHLPPEIAQVLRGIHDPAALCNLLVFAMCRDPQFQQGMLETTDTARRLECAIERFRNEAGLLRLHRRLQGNLHDEEIGHN